MDRIELCIGPPPGEGANYRAVEIRINGLPLLEILRRIEEPHVASEMQERLAAGESPEDLAGLVAAGYMYPTIAVLREHSGEFFGAIDSKFQLEPTDPASGKTCVLDCDCGNSGCWPFLARISLMGATVTWSGFAQFHRDWTYELGSFEFDRSQYENELSRVCEGG